MKRAGFVLMTALALSSTICAVGLATQVMPTNLADMMKAELIFTGRCTSAEARVISSPSGGAMPVTAYTFSVEPGGVLKGEVPVAFSFTQLGVSREDARRLGVPFVVGMPRYSVGREYTLFLTSASGIGLRSPVGLGQGKFSVIVGQDGKKQVVNSRGNKGLFTNLPATKAFAKALGAAKISAAAPPPAGPIGFDDFVEMVKALKDK